MGIEDTKPINNNININENKNILRFSRLSRFPCTLLDMRETQNTKLSHEKLKNISQMVANRKKIFSPLCEEKNNCDSNEPEISKVFNLNFSTNFSKLKNFEELEKSRISKCSINLKENIERINYRNNLKPLNLNSNLNLNNRECSSVLKNITNPKYLLNTHTLNSRASSKSHLDFENIYSNLYPESTKFSQKQDKKGNFSQRTRKRGSKRFSNSFNIHPGIIRGHQDEDFTANKFI